MTQRRLKTLEESTQRLREKREEIDRRLTAQEGKKRHLERQLHTRKIILMGEMVLHLIETGGIDKSLLWKNLDKYLSNERDRVLFDLPSLQGASNNAENQAHEAQCDSIALQRKQGADACH